MSSEPQESAGDSANFLAFDKTNEGNNRGHRQNFHQYRPYNRHQNYRNQNFRRNQQYQQFGAPQQNDDDPQFAPANYSSPVPHQQRFDNGGGGGGGGWRQRPNQMNQQFHQRRNFVPFNRFGGGGGGGGGGNSHHQKPAAPIQQYFHKSMLEDPWADCHHFNGTEEGTNEATNDPFTSAANELSAET